MSPYLGYMNNPSHISFVHRKKTSDSPWHGMAWGTSEAATKDQRIKMRPVRVRALVLTCQTNGPEKWLM